MGAGEPNTWTRAQSRVVAADLVDAGPRQADVEHPADLSIAAEYAAATSIALDDLAEPLDVSESAILAWRGAQGVVEVRNPQQAVPVALLTEALYRTWRPEGTVLRMRSPRRQLHGATPLDLLAESAQDGRALLNLARAERGQLAS